MTKREKIAILALLSTILFLTVLRMYIEQRLVSMNVEHADILRLTREQRARNLDLRTVILEESSLWKIREKAFERDFLPDTGDIVVID